MMSEPFHAPRKKQRFFLTAILVLSLMISWFYRQSWAPFFMDALAPALIRFDAWSETFPWNKNHAPPVNLDLETLARENNLLQKQLEALTLVAEENRQLRQLMALEMPEGYQQLAARVILRSPNEWFETLLLNKGFEEGVTVNMVVMNETGVVGKIIQVTARTSRVQLLSDPDSSVSCVVGEKKVPGVLTGQYKQEMAQLEYLQNYAKIHSGDHVLTSGLGGVFPPNLMLGEVRYVHEKSTQPVPDSNVALIPLERSLEHLIILIPEL